MTVWTRLRGLVAATLFTAVMMSVRMSGDMVPCNMLALNISVNVAASDPFAKNGVMSNAVPLGPVGTSGWPVAGSVPVGEVPAVRNTSMARVELGVTAWLTILARTNTLEVFWI